MKNHRCGSLLLALIAATAIFAQSSPGEFGRGSGGEIAASIRHGRNLSGTLGLTHTSGGRRAGYEGTFGGSLVPDRIWFFASAAQTPLLGLGSRVDDTNVRVSAKPVDWNNITATFAQTGNDQLTAPQLLPSQTNFLSLRSTTIFSDTMVMNVSVSRSTIR
ncbi:MAG TPA: hypothetical protein VF824_17515 [Thermoanaerobaculia bacterium]|jgi:hypothetical protein